MINISQASASRKMRARTDESAMLIFVNYKSSVFNGFAFSDFSLMLKACILLSFKSQNKT